MHGKQYLEQIKQNLFIRAMTKFVADHGFEHAGYCAFLHLFSVIPLFIILIAAMSLVYETESGIEIIKSVINLLPDYAVSFVKPQIDAIFSKPSVNLISFVFLGTIWTTSSSLEGMRTIFNKIYHVQNPPFFLISRMISMLQFLFLILCSVFSVATLIILPKIIHLIERTLHRKLPDIDYPYTNTIIILMILIGIISVIYYSLTNKKMMFIEVIPGAILTVLLWYLSINLLTYYIANLADFNVVYGSMTGVIITLTFLYLVNIILIYGAEVNYIFKRHHPHAFQHYIYSWHRILSLFTSSKKR